MAATKLPPLSRRRALLGLAALASTSCRRRGAPSPPEPAPAAAEAAAPGWKELAFEPASGGEDPQRALLLAPAAAGAPPLLVALHGRGEAVRGVEVGARGWRDDYALDATLKRLLAPPLAPEDLGGMVTRERLAQLNASLRDHPYAGLCIATPFTPDLRDRSVEGAAGFGRFVVERLLPRARAEGGCKGAREATGIDGVSLGGRLALLVGLSNPDVFGAVGALQPAVRASEAEMFSTLARRAMERHAVALRLVSSEADPFLPAIQAISDRLRHDSVAHELLIVPGPHDYAWNRGPGGVEMVLWHERVQRGLSPP
ncbi:alpha/beta hydrolase-fold protein [Sorangium sp. So ce291]|uniref:alpha/beta hydrolase-fold protein n=1 Tax=Sorangium sp. So ce291 TaxID=3133294 RepID=UPI003F61E88F